MFDPKNSHSRNTSLQRKEFKLPCLPETYKVNENVTPFEYTLPEHVILNASMDQGNSFDDSNLK
jgi:hypothetical protein